MKKLLFFFTLLEIFYMVIVAFSVAATFRLRSILVGKTQAEACDYLYY